MKRLAVIPSDPLSGYIRAGFSPSWLQAYYNPGGFFEEVYALSPLEKERGRAWGMEIIPTVPGMLRKRVKELRIDIVRAYGGYWPCEMACNHRVNGIPVVVSVHDRRPEFISPDIRRADIVFCVSEAVRKAVLEKTPRADRIRVVPNRVDLEVMRPRAEAGEELSARYPFKYRILFVGRKSREKNLDTLIKTLRVLGSEFALIAAGTGSAEEYERLAEEQGVRGRCVFLDAVPNEDLPGYYSWVDCFCVPSRSEGFGIVFIEALACGAVVVTSDAAPMNEYIEHLKNGLLVREYENPFALAEMIRWACTDGALRARLKRHARASVERFAWQAVDAVEIDCYRNVFRMKDQGEFFHPFWEQFLSASEAQARRILPKPIKDGLRSFLPTGK